MAIFEYDALTSSGRLMKGTVEAASWQQAQTMLDDMKLSVNQLQRAKEQKPKTAVGRSEFLLFNQQLASITKSGIPLERALRELSDDIGSKSMRKLITSIADELEAGVSIDTAIEQREKQFPPLYGKILKAGVQTGRLSEMLTSMNRHLETQTRTRRIIFEALCYPAVVLILAVVIVSSLFVTIVPAFAEVLTDLGDGATLPALTLWILNISENIVSIWISLAAFIAVIVMSLAFLSASPASRRFKESLVMNIPVIGRLYHAGVLARLSDAMALLVSSGCDMPACLTLGAHASGSERTTLECDMLAKGIAEGAGIMETGCNTFMIPKLFLYSVQLGSQRNELQDNLYSLSEMYTEQTKCLQGRLEAVLEPVLIIFLGLTIGTIVIAMFLPMVKMMEVLM